MDSRPIEILINVPASRSELRRNRRRRLFVAVAAVLVLVGGFSLRPGLHQLRRWHARRLAREAREFMAREQWQKAAADIQQALRLNGSDPAVLLEDARLLNATGNFASAVVVWKQLQQSGGLTTVEEHRDFATAALETGEHGEARKQIARLHELHSDTPTEWLLEARLAEADGDRGLAIGLARKILSISPNDEERSRASMILLADSADSSLRNFAWENLRRLTKSSSVASLVALNFIAGQEAAMLRGQSAFEAVPPIDPVLVADLLERHPKAQMRDYLHATELRVALHPSDRDELIAAAVRHFAKPDNATLAILCFWLLGQNEPTTVLSLLPAEKATHTAQLCVARIEALSSLQDWRVLESELSDSHLPSKLDELTTDLYLARCALHLDEKSALKNRWDRAFELAANDPRKLLAVGQAAEHDRLLDKAEAAYRASIRAEPRNAAAYAALLHLLAANDGARAAYTLLQRMAQQWPNEKNVVNSEIYAGVMCGELRLAMARERAEKLIADAPHVSDYRATLALILLKMNQPQAALTEIGDISAEIKSHRARISTVAIHAAVLAANGFPQQARDEARALAPSALVPEERAMLEPILSDNPG